MLSVLHVLHKCLITLRIHLTEYQAYQLAAGTPHEVAQCEGSYTGQFLKKLGL